jgi:hypothetical protein
MCNSNFFEVYLNFQYWSISRVFCHMPMGDNANDVQREVISSNRRKWTMK